MPQTSIWWIRRDVRLRDNPALDAALKNGDCLLPLFILEPDLMEKSAPKRRAFLLHALANLDRELQHRGSHLIVRRGPAQQAFQALADELDGVTIFAHQDYSPFARQRDRTITEHWDLRLHPGVVFRHPADILKNNGEPYTVFTPYKNKWYREPLPNPGDCLPAPLRLPPLPQNLNSDPLPAAQPVPGFPATAGAAHSRLTAFTTGPIQHYKSRRDKLDLDGTSHLSSYLRFGLVSTREAFVQSQIAFLQAEDESTRAEIRTWMDELVWREFYTAILYHFPRVMSGSFREAYQHIPWRDAPQDLQAWQAGRTGFPIVDACMRQLKATGWMHNRGRMIVASFLTKDLLINWQHGEAWFMDNLIDGDPAANNGGWQWSAGTGTDAAPYFRIFNPVLQGQKHDPKGAFIACWVPELASLPVKYRHEPWKLSEKESVKYRFKLGQDYPQPILDHAFARQRALDAYRSIRKQPEFHKE